MGNLCAAGVVNVLGAIVVHTGKGLWLLSKLGFKATGVAANSVASSAMSFFGNVKVGSVIAAATSMAMSSR